MSINQQTSDVNGLTRFANYALIGGGLPAVLLLVADYVVGFKLVPSNQSRVFIAGIVGLFILYGIIIVGFQKWEQDRTRARTLLYLAAVLSVADLHTFVLATGGSIHSYFSFHYLYIPAVIAIAFPGSRALYIAAGCSFTSFLINLYCVNIPYYGDIPFLSFESTPEWQCILLGHPYKLAFATMFTIQLVMAVLIARLQPAGSVTSRDAVNGELLIP